nr:hypothetical protein [Serratia proteamaculans]
MVGRFQPIDITLSADNIHCLPSYLAYQLRLLQPVLLFFLIEYRPDITVAVLDIRTISASQVSFPPVSLIDEFGTTTDGETDAGTAKKLFSTKNLSVVKLTSEQSFSQYTQPVTTTFRQCILTLATFCPGALFQHVRPFPQLR